MNRGGIESFMMNYYRKFDREKVQIDFVVHDAGGYGYYDEEIKSMGGNIYMLPKKSTHPFTYIYRLKKILNKGNYKIIHVHMDAIGAWVLKAAKECGIPVRIAHSHNTQHLTNNPLKLWFLERARKNINKYATHRMACSEAAGKWLFGDAPFEVVRNAIEVERFAYNEQYRKEIRTEYKVSDNEFLIGHVGRFDTQKNHSFLIDVFAEVNKQIPNSRLILIGGGNLTFKDCLQQIAKHGLTEKVIITGVRDDVYKFYSAFDVFVLPSLFEGLTVVSIEAQMNGCPNILSSNISSEVNMSGNVKLLPLQMEDWIKAITNTIKEGIHREKACFDTEHSGYNIDTESRLLQQKYIELWNKN